MDQQPRRMGIVQDLEMLARRARVLILVIPVLLLVGFGVGQLLSRGLSVREDSVARVTSAEPANLQLAAVTQQMQVVQRKAEHTAEYVRIYQEEVAPIEHVLRRRGISHEIARKVAWPLVEQSYRNGVDPSTVLSVMLIESAGRPNARSPVGARGLMQVMPAWAGHWRACGRDLYAIEDNLCYGTKILAMYLDRHRGDERRALLGYNGCVRGAFTSNCGLYPDKVASIRREVRSELAVARQRAAVTRVEASQ